MENVIKNSVLRDIVNNIEYRITNLCNDDESCIELLNKAFSDFSDFIYNNFKDREAEIRNIYKELRENSFPYNRVETVRVNVILSIFDDYFNGLVDYVSHVRQLSDNDEVDANNIKSKLIQMAEMNSVFIQNLAYGHDYESDCINDIKIDTCIQDSLNDAMKNVECLCEVKNKFDEYRNTFKNILTNISSKYRDIQIIASKMAIIAVVYFNAYILDQIISCYINIQASMTKRVGVNEKITPEYRVF